MSPSCGVCFSSYDGEEKMPLMLPCGHTFCKSCVTKLRNNACPSCRKVFTTNVSDLPVVFQLLEYSDQETSISPQIICKLHSKHLYIMCRTCNTLVCWQCANLTHQDCDVGVLNIHRENFKVSVEQHVRDTNKKSNGRLERLEELEKAVDKTLLEIEELKVKLINLKKSISNTGSNLKKDLDSLDDYKDSVNCLTDEQFLKQGYSRIQNVADNNRSTVLPRLDAELITKLSALVSELSDSLDSLNLPTVDNYIFNEGRTWYLNNNESIRAASKVFNETSKRPSELTIDVSSITDTTIVEKLLTKRSFGYNVILGCFNENLTPDENRQKLQDIIKCLSKDRIETHLLLNGFFTAITFKKLQEEFGNRVVLRQIGIADKEDVDLLTKLNMSSARIWRSVEPNALKKLPVGYSYSVHFPPLSDSDIDWLSAVIDKLFSASHPPSIYLKNPTLTRCGLDRLVGMLRDKRWNHGVYLYLQSSHISDNIKNNYSIGRVHINWIK